MRGRGMGSHGGACRRKASLCHAYAPAVCSVPSNRYTALRPAHDVASAMRRAAARRRRVTPSGGGTVKAMVTRIGIASTPVNFEARPPATASPAAIGHHVPPPRSAFQKEYTAAVMKKDGLHVARHLLAVAEERGLERVEHEGEERRPRARRARPPIGRRGVPGRA